MKKLFIISLILSISKICFAANWTGYGNISEISQQSPYSSSPADVMIVANLPDNPTTCVEKNTFHLKVETERDKRTLTMILSAFMAGKQVRLYVTDDCPTWDIPLINGIKVKY